MAAALVNIGGAVQLAPEDLRLAADSVARLAPSAADPIVERQALIELAAELRAIAAAPGDLHRLFLAPRERRFLRDAVGRLEPDETSTALDMLRVQLELVGD